MKSKAQEERSSEGRFAYEGLDRVIHERARLSVLTSLITNPKGLTFVDLKQLCSLTDGNLSRHLQVLEKAEIVEIVKGHDRNRPQTICRITASGRKRHQDHARPAHLTSRPHISATSVESKAHHGRAAEQWSQAVSVCFCGGLHM